MNKLLLTVTAILSISVNSFAETVVLEDTPNPGDTTIIETITSGNPVTTGNLLSQQWNDGSWEGTMFPDSSDINENIYLTGKDGKYAESTINSEGLLTEQEIQAGITSTLTAKVRWWNQWQSTVTMTQTATSELDTTTQSIILEDTTNHNNQFNSHTNTLIIAPDPNNGHGTLSARFSFDIEDAAGNWNNGHSGADVIEPNLQLNYNALSSTTVTTVEFCWEKNPPTCPGQDEIADVIDIIEELEDLDWEENIYETDTITGYNPSDMPIDNFFMGNDIEYGWEYEEETFEAKEEYLELDDFFFEENYVEYNDYEEPELAYIPETTLEMELDWNDSNVDLFNDLPLIEEVYETVTEEMFVEEFTDEMQEDFIEEIEIAEEITIEEAQPESEPVEEITMIEEEIIEETPNEIEEQPSSKDIVADEPEQTTEVAEQEETIEEPVEVATNEASTSEEPTATKENVEVDLDFKVAKIEQAIQGKIKDVAQQVNATLTVVNELVSREIAAQEPDMSSYFNTNQALFDAKELPSGNADFFIQNNLDEYNKPIYLAQADIGGTDPVVQYQIKVNKARSETDQAYKKLKELLNARNGI